MDIMFCVCVMQITDKQRVKIEIIGNKLSNC